MTPWFMLSHTKWVIGTDPIGIGIKPISLLVIFSKLWKIRKTLTRKKISNGKRYSGSLKISFSNSILHFMGEMALDGAEGTA